MDSTNPDRVEGAQSPTQGSSTPNQVSEQSPYEVDSTQASVKESQSTIAPERIQTVQLGIGTLPETGEADSAIFAAGLTALLARELLLGKRKREEETD